MMKNTNNNDMFDYVIVGAGIVGSSIFSALARSGKSVCMIDKALDVGTGAAKANSGLVHAGFDAKPGTLKAKLNVLGNKMYPLEAKRLGLSIKKTGAYVVGNDKEKLEELLARGKTNGVDGLHLLSGSELKAKLPMLNPEIKYALFAENAYVISPYMFTICLAEEGIVNGGRVVLGFDAKRIKKHGDIFTISDGFDEIKTKYIINSSGAGYNEIANMIGSEIYELEFRRGEYFVLDSTEKNLVPSTVFPLPSKAGKGVLVTPTVDGNILVGPSSQLSDDITKTTAEGLSFVRSQASNMIPSINFKKTIRIFSGIRTVVGDDFVIEKSREMPNVINIAGICSPGLSAAPAIALYVLNLLGLDTKIPAAKKIKPYVALSSLPVSKKNELIARNPLYGKIVCKCEGISEGEIVDALSRPLRVVSVDGIKRRTRTGMGRCQGGFCLSKTIELIAKKNNITLFDVVKENKGSNIIVSGVKKS
ncbi:MAG: FAD-dependent oxidoreductase [Clostridia bacterium]|nr:FAD-dependent oxidoreductase [Clostridia bacterium]